jgi:hypothetical protein
VKEKGRTRKYKEKFTSKNNKYWHFAGGEKYGSEYCIFSPPPFPFPDVKRQSKTVSADGKQRILTYLSNLGLHFCSCVF